MESDEMKLAGLVAVILAVLLGVAVPSCMKSHDTALLKCIELRPNLSPADCQQALRK